MKLFRSERFPAAVLLISAALGLIVANSPAEGAVSSFLDVHSHLPGALDLSVHHMISDGLLVFFFFVVAVELQYELTKGHLNSFSRAVQPAIAAAGGILVPIIIYVIIAGNSSSARGWPIPTATDIAFALGVLAVFGRGLPSPVRVFLLALAILDDIVGIIFIAVLFTDDVNVPMLLCAVASLIAFAVVSRVRSDRFTPLLVTALALLAVATWYFVLASGIHATIAGVALGLVMAPAVASKVSHALEPWVNAVVLPVFAFTAAFVVIPAVSLAALSPAFWGIAIALPVGKIIGISLAGWLSLRVGKGAPTLHFLDILAAGALGGIGFTVSLLLSELAFGAGHEMRDQAILGVLVGSMTSLILAAVLVSWRARYHRRRQAEEALA